MRTFVLHLLLLAALATAAAGCAGKTRLPEATPGTFPLTAESTNFESDTDAFPARAKTEHQLLREGDVIEIGLLEDEMVSGEYPIGPDGTISVPLIGDIACTNTLREDLEEEIEARLARYYEEPDARVSVAEYRPRHAYILGAVRAPGAVELSPNENLLTAVTKAGGMIERKNERNQSLGFPQMARILRQNRDIAFVNMLDVLNGRDMRANVAIFPDDIIFVPLEGTPTVSVLGEVGRPGLYGLGPGMDITQAIALAGGFTQNADITRVRIIRGWWEPEPQIYTLNYRDIRSGKYTAPLLLRDQDIIVAQTHYLVKYNWVVQQVSPTLTTLSLGAITSEVLTDGFYSDTESGSGGGDSGGSESTE